MKGSSISSHQHNLADKSDHAMHNVSECVMFVDHLSTMGWHDGSGVSNIATKQNLTGAFMNRVGMFSCECSGFFHQFKDMQGHWKLNCPKV